MFPIYVRVHQCILDKAATYVAKLYYSTIKMSDDEAKIFQECMIVLAEMNKTRINSRSRLKSECCTGWCKLRDLANLADKYNDPKGEFKAQKLCFDSTCKLLQNDHKNNAKVAEILKIFTAKGDRIMVLSAIDMQKAAEMMGALVRGLAQTCYNNGIKMRMPDQEEFISASRRKEII
jgi:hypothetical protein